MDDIRMKTQEHSLSRTTRKAGVASIVALGLFGVPCPAFTASEGTQIVMTSQLDPEKREHGRFVQLVYTEAFKRLGLEMVFQYYPAARASHMADIGTVDGELSRVFHYNNSHSVLVRVDEPAFVVRFSAFATNPSIEVNGWDSLNKTPYRVEYRLGSKIVHERLKARVPRENLSVVTHESQGIRKLLAGRTDVYIHEEEAVLDLLSSTPFRAEMEEDFGLRTIHKVGVLEEQTIHAFLHERHRELVPRLSAVLKAMRAEGLLEHYSQIVKTP